MHGFATVADVREGDKIVFLDDAIDAAMPSVGRVTWNWPWHDDASTWLLSMRLADGTTFDCEPTADEPVFILTRNYVLRAGYKIKWFIRDGWEIVSHLPRDYKALTSDRHGLTRREVISGTRRHLADWLRCEWGSMWDRYYYVKKTNATR